MWTTLRLQNLAGALPVFIVFLIGSASGRAQQARETLRISGYNEEAPIVRMNGRSYVDLESLARITNGSLSFHGNQIVLSLAGSAANSPSETSANNPPGLSKEFIRAGLEALAAIREWTRALSANVEMGYPVENGIDPYRATALDSVRFASVAASTSSDQRALDLLNAQVNNVNTWNSNLVSRASSLSLGSFTTGDGLNSDALFQKLQHCSQSVGNMLASGVFQDDPSCH